MKIVLDTNWLISYVINRENGQLRLVLIDTSISIITTEKQIREFLQKIYHQKFRRYFEIGEALEFIQNFAKRSEFIISISEVKVCRDPKDNYLLALSKDANADFLITGDNDLLSIGRFENTVICNLSDFIQKHFKQ